MSIKLSPADPRRAEKEHAKGEADYLRFIRGDEELTRQDREFIARVHEYLYWRAFDSSKSTREPKAPPRYRAPGRKADPRIAAIFSVLAISGWPDQADTIAARREMIVKLTGLSWNALRQRIDRLEASTRDYARTSLGLTGQNKRTE